MSDQSNRSSLMRSYWWIAPPVMLSLIILLLLVAVWQARQHVVDQLGYEMTIVAQRLQAQPDNIPTVLASLPAPPIERQLFAINSRYQVIGRAGELPDSDRWSFTFDERPLQTNVQLGRAYERGNWLTGDLLYFWQPPDATYGFVAIADAPLAVRTALRWMLLPLVALTLLFCTFGIILEVSERRRAGQYEKLVRLSAQVINGRIDTSISVRGERTTIGRIAQIVDEMRRALKRRIDEDARLLRVSQVVAGTMDLNEGMPLILDAVVEATGVAGARALVFNTDGGVPLRFGSGPREQQMAELDRKLYARVLHTSDELTLRDPQSIRQTLGVEEEETPVAALVALPMMAKGRLLGALWTGYEQPLSEQPDYDTLRAYVTRAALLAANARLFDLAEGGRRRLAGVLASTTEPIAVTDRTDRFVLVNPAMEATFGLDAREVAGRQVADIIKQPTLLTALTGDIDKANGRTLIVGERTLLLSVSLVKGQDKRVLGRVAVFHDITPLKQLETLQADFVRNVSHDLRNPLTYMHNYATLLGDQGPLNAKQQRSLSEIVGGINRMHRTIGVLLDLNRIESANEPFNCELIEAQPFLALLASEYQAQAHSQGNNIVIDAPQAPVMLYADRWLLRMALQNLLVNALKYAADTGVITIGVRQSDDQHILFVRDSGPGISKSDQVRLFEKYYRAARAEALQTEGSGLGLAIVKSIAERHTGRAWVESALGKGSTFYLALPTREALAEPDTEPEIVMAD